MTQQAKAGLLVVALIVGGGVASPARGQKPRVPSFDQPSRVVELNSRLRTLAIHPDNKLVATGTDNGAVQLWDIATGNKAGSFGGHKGMVTCVAFSPDGKTLASAGRDDGVKLWNVEKTKLIASISTQAYGGGMISSGVVSSLKGLVFSPDGRTLFTLGKVIMTWDPATGRQRGTVTGVASGLAFSPDGKRIAWLNTAASTIPNGNRVTTVGTDTVVSVREAGSYKLVRGLPVIKGFNDPSMAFSPDGAKLAIGGEIKILDLATGKSEGLAKKRTNGTVAGFTPDGKYLMVVPGGSVAFWEVATGERKFFVIVSPTSSTAIGAATLSPDGKTLVTASLEKLQFWNLPELLK